MAASGSEMEVVLVAQAAQFIKTFQEVAALNASVAKSTTELARSMGALPGATKPAEAAVGGLAQTFKNFKRDQVQEGRMVGFYVRELTAFTGASAGLQSALGGITQGIIGFATASGPLLMVWAGFEIFKGLASWFTEIGDAATKAAEEAGKAVSKLGDELAALANKRLGIGPGDVAQAKVDAGQKLLAAREAASQALSTGGGREVQDAAYRRYEALQKEITAWEKVNGKLETYIALQAQIAAEAGGQFGPGTEKGVTTFVSESTKGKIDSDKAAAERLKLVYENLANEMQRLADEEDRAVTVQAERLKVVLAEIRAAAAAESAKYNDAAVAGPGNNKGEIDFTTNAVENLNAEAMKSASIFASLGDSIGSAFGSIGEMVGGVSGQVMKVLGQMIQQAIQLAISLAMASMAWTSPLGMVAIGAIALAGILGIMAAVPSFEVGTSYVPRTGLAMLHQGEAVIPASQNRGGGGASIVVNVSTPDAQSFERMLRRNDSALVRVLREASASGRL